MNKQELNEFLGEIFKPLGFKKKGNNLVNNCGEVTKMVNIQQSNYGNQYYLNFGYIIKDLELNTRMHVSRGVGSKNREINTRIQDLLDLTSPISDFDRKNDLRIYIDDMIVAQFKRVNSTKDLLNNIESDDVIYTVFGDVLNYFGLKPP